MIYDFFIHPQRKGLPKVINLEESEHNVRKWTFMKKFSFSTLHLSQWHPTVTNDLLMKTLMMFGVTIYKVVNVLHRKHLRALVRVVDTFNL